MENSLTPYEGNEPYIFVSYSRKDSDKVFDIIQQLQSKGLNFCYSTEIKRGNEWQEYILKCINNCSRVIAFHSQNSKNSARCRDEISFAYHADKKIYSVYLEDVELSVGVKMAIHHFPFIKLYECTPLDEEKFYSELSAKIYDIPVVGGLVSSIVGVGVLGGIGIACGGFGGIGKIDKPTVTNANKGKILSNVFGFVKNIFSDKKHSIRNKKKFPAASLKKDSSNLLSSYEGNAPYAFVSYSHKDSNKVFEILRKLQSAGLRFWYDAGIKHGSEWDECIAEHICSCNCMIAFHSRNSNCSPHCKNEISFLNDDGSDKKILSIFLEDVELSKGTKMKIHRFQAINFYDYPTKTNFYSELLRAPVLQSCFQ